MNLVAGQRYVEDFYAGRLIRIIREAVPEGNKGDRWASVDAMNSTPVESPTNMINL
jgi:hypothetical protein